MRYLDDIELVRRARLPIGPLDKEIFMHGSGQKWHGKLGCAKKDNWEKPPVTQKIPLIDVPSIATRFKRCACLEERLLDESVGDYPKVAASLIRLDGELKSLSRITELAEAGGRIHDALWNVKIHGYEELMQYGNTVMENAIAIGSSFKSEVELKFGRRTGEKKIVATHGPWVDRYSLLYLTTASERAVDIDCKKTLMLVDSGLVENWEDRMVQILDGNEMENRLEVALRLWAPGQQGSFSSIEAAVEAAQLL